MWYLMELLGRCSQILWNPWMFVSTSNESSSKTKIGFAKHQHCLLSMVQSSHVDRCEFTMCVKTKILIKSPLVFLKLNLIVKG